MKKKTSSDDFSKSSRAISPIASTILSDQNRIAATEDAYTNRVSSPLRQDSHGSATPSSNDDQPNDHREHLKAESKPAIADAHVTESAVSRPKAKLGRIGGSSKASKDPSSQSAGDGKATAPSSQQQSPFRPKTKEKATSPRSVEENIVSGRSGRAESRYHASPPRESSQDRANRKREQLKRELENKGQSGAKRKRKF